MRLSYDEIRADKAKMEKFVCERVSGDVTRIDLGGGAWADLHPCWDDEYGWSLLIETDEPEWVDLWEVYQHFRRKEMTAKEWWQEFDREMAKGKIFDLEKENAAMGYELNQLRAPTGSAIPLIPALADLASIAKSLARIADVVDPPPPDKVDTSYVAKRLGIGLARVSQMAGQGEIPPSCIVAGTGKGKLWKFHRARIDEWIDNGRT